ncbi:Fe-S protein assembly co-chaperone HscB [Magnetovirga frankeli]|uniref:Fe-S protein assembly co-chaperone HscB n=1 Tax=Magnetovirga frankeli TaxID=947516 RepID=UPI001292EF59|nr:Fe-S protein assembly co-chaperone HscB [gamma proteobacterium SS-5]
MLDFGKNYFELFGLPQVYRLDQQALAERYRELQRVTHPDRHAAADDRQRRLAVQAAAQVNAAYETLKDPMLRARYLLALLGVEMAEQGESTQDGAFLMEQMEMREELEAAKAAADPYAVTADLASRIEQQTNSLIARMAMYFETASTEQLEQAREIVRKMQFLQKLAQEVDRVERELDEL